LATQADSHNKAASNVGLRKNFLLFTRHDDSLLDRFARLASSIGRKFLVIDAQHSDMNIEAIGQRRTDVFW
jgi:hypothetical protein